MITFHFHLPVYNAVATPIAKAIKVNKMLSNLNLVDNGISNAGGKCVADASKVNNTLTHLDLPKVILAMPVLHILLRNSKSTTP